MAITLTAKAEQHIKKFLEKRGKGIGVRLAIYTTGCSGLAYKLEYADQIADKDIVFNHNGLQLLVDEESLKFLDGTELDFVREGLNEGFKFHNPNASDVCGCGESFRVNPDTAHTKSVSASY